jgi:hypothetical protein
VLSEQECIATLLHRAKSAERAQAITARARRFLGRGSEIVGITEESLVIATKAG